MLNITSAQSVMSALSEKFEKQIKNLYCDKDDSSMPEPHFLDKLLNQTTEHSYRSYPHRNNEKMLQQIISEEQKRGYHYYPTYNLEKIYPQIVTICQKYLQGKIMLDLGCGKHGTGLALADFFQAAGYIGVEMQRGSIGKEAMEQIETKVPYLLIQEDMSDVIEFSYYNDIKYDCIIFSGIDWYSLIIKNYHGYKCACRPSEYEYLVSKINKIQNQEDLLIWGGYTGDMYVGDSFENILKNYQLIDQTEVKNLADIFGCFLLAKK